MAVGLGGPEEDGLGARAGDNSKVRRVEPGECMEVQLRPPRRRTTKRAKAFDPLCHRQQQAQPGTPDRRVAAPRTAPDAHEAPAARPKHSCVFVLRHAVANRVRGGAFYSVYEDMPKEAARSMQYMGKESDEREGAIGAKLV